VIAHLDPTWFRLVFEPGIGAGLGATSLLYGLARGAELLGDEALLDAALRGADSVTEERIAQDTRLDLMGGVAGAALALLALHRARPSDRLLETARQCGRHLLEHRRPGSPDGPRAWPTLGGALLSGLSHGAAGIVLALERLHAATGDGAFLDAALEGRAWENASFEEAEGNWPDHRFPKGPRGHAFQVAWCHGASGIGLARLGRPGGPDADGLRDVERALQATLAAPVSDLDHACCGEVGRAEFLLEAGRRLGRPELLNESRRRVERLVERARRRGRYALGFTSGPDVPSFHQGTAGVGWQLLRCLRPEVPSVLLWE
jgi:lantibiotic modifying enzyme